MTTSFQIGDGATALGYSDRYAGTVVAMKGKTLTWRRDKATLLNSAGSGEPDALRVYPGGFLAHVSGTQRYTYAPGDPASDTVYSLRKNGRWIRKGEDLSGRGLVAGRSEHYDYNF